MSRPLVRVAGVLTALVATVGLAACGGDSSAAGGAPASVRVGYFPNVTHATAIVGATRRASSPSTSVRRSSRSRRSTPAPPRWRR